MAGLGLKISTPAGSISRRVGVASNSQFPFGKFSNHFFFPYTCNIATAPFVVVHAIDAPLIYSDGKHPGADGTVLPTQFEYHYYNNSSDQ